MVGRFRAAAAALALGAAGGLAACAYNEELGRNQLLLVNDASLAQSAQQAWAQTLASNRVSQDRAGAERVRRVGSRLVEAAGLSDRPWEYVLFENPQANAFVLPGGKIGVNTGLLAIVENDDQLAAVLGHEIAHTVAQHAAERYSHAAATQLAIAGAQGALGGSNPDLGRQVASLGGVGAQLGVLMPFSRQHELEADRLGVDYMARAGYRPAEAIALWRNMAARAQAGGRPPQFLSTHPSEATRIAALEQYLASRGML
ncbi:MAG: M48 family metallopeptidase [Phenylobacterium sp.]|uniref:M48 family metallopeptidase n=1 Tax=Phenylobacterium sp. TaxID=1871053 RepID=UPI00391C33E7